MVPFHAEEDHVQVTADTSFSFSVTESAAHALVAVALVLHVCLDVVCREVVSRSSIEDTLEVVDPL